MKKKIYFIKKNEKKKNMVQILNGLLPNCVLRRGIVLQYWILYCRVLGFEGKDCIAIQSLCPRYSKGLRGVRAGRAGSRLGAGRAGSKLGAHAGLEGRACWACRERAAGGHAWGARAWRAGRAGERHGMGERSAGGRASARQGKRARAERAWWALL